MSCLRDDEIRRLIAHLRRQIHDEASVAEFEDVLRSDEAQEFLREPEILTYFPLITETFDASGVRWQLRIIPHAHLRSVQRGISIKSVTSLFRRFVEWCDEQAVAITIGNYSVTARPAPRKHKLTIRFEVNQANDSEGAAHVVTVVIGVTRVSAEVINVAL